MQVNYFVEINSYSKQNGETALDIVSKFGNPRMSQVQKTLRFRQGVICLLSSKLNSGTGLKCISIRKLPSEMFRMVFEFLGKQEEEE